MAVACGCASLVAAAPAAGEITVSLEGRDELASYGSVSCQRVKGRLEARQRSADGRLHVVVRRFHGRGRYELEYGHGSDANVLYDPMAQASPEYGAFTNLNEPEEEADRLTFVGALQVTVKRGRTRIAIAAPIVYDGEKGDVRWVRITGAAVCGR